MELNIKIDIIRILLYLIQILVISYGIYIGYKNFHELKRKNNTEEAPYLSIQQIKGRKILLKNYGKSPVIIKKIESIYDDEIYSYIGILVLKMENKEEIMPNEEKEIKIGALMKKDSTFCSLKVYYENHIEKKIKKLEINFSTPTIHIIK